MQKQTIIDKFTQFDGEELKLTEEELTYIVKDWIQTQFKTPVSKISTYGYTHDIFVKSGVRIEIKK